MSETDSGLTTYYLYDGEEPLLEVASDGTLLAGNAWGADGLRGRYYPGPSQRFPDTFNPNTGQTVYSAAAPALYSYLYDPQGSVSQRQAIHLGTVDPTDPQHAHDEYEVLDERAYDAFGLLRGVQYGSTATGSGGPGSTTAAWGQEVLGPDPVGFGGQWGYLGLPGSTASLLGHRVYDASTGRFLNRDPIGYAGGVNLYGFAGNNPVNEMDPEGLSPAGDAASIVGLVPGPIGMAANLASAADSFHDGDYFGAGLSALGEFPALGEFATGAKIARAANRLREAEEAYKTYQASKAVKLLNPPIVQTAKRVQHVLERHTYSGIVKFAKKSKFNVGENISELIASTAHHPVVRQSNGRFARTVNIGRDIGLDKMTGKQTSVMTVITEPDGELVTAFPGRP